MEPERVDALLRMLVSPKSRRASLRLLTASLVGGLGVADADLTAAKSRKKKKCPTGKTRCKVSKKKSVCVDLSTDAANCGACGTPCPGPDHGSGSATCSGSACSIACAAGTTLCQTDCVALATDLANCGACGTICPHNACQTATCDGGQCGTTPNGCPTTTGEQCYWLNCQDFNDACCWVTASSIGISAPNESSCEALDHCQSGGACFKWSTSSCD